MNTQDMIRSHPRAGKVDRSALAKAIELCFRCAKTCTMCADACLGESDPRKMARCIRTDLDCADVCTAAGRVLARLTEMDQEMLQAQVQACITACRVCGAECEQHASKMEHCRICAQACRECEEALQSLQHSVGAA